MNNRIKSFCLTLAAGLMLAVLPGTAQDVPATSSGDIRFHVDHACFRGGDGLTYAEFYLMLYADQITDYWRDGGHYGAFQVNSRLSAPGDDKVQEREWSTEAVISQDAADLKSLAIYDQWAEKLAPGTYSLAVHVTDKNGKSGVLQSAVQIPEMSGEQFSCSQIEFVSHYGPMGQDVTFAKGQQAVIPNPSRRFGVLNPILYFYYELYHVPDVDRRPMSVDYTIRTAGAIATKSPLVQSVQKPGGSAAVLHGIDVSHLSSGIYDLTATVRDSASGLQVAATRRFEVIQMDYLDLQPSLTVEQADAAGNMLRLVAPAEEYELYKKLTLPGKSKFLIQFWRDRDPTPGTVENEYLGQIQQRFRYARENFGWGQMEGWETERGRVLVQYGMPDDIERHAYEAETNPYDIWLYRQDRTYAFVFGDLQANGNYVLLHSTNEQEIHNTDWLTLLKKY